MSDPSPIVTKESAERAAEHGYGVSLPHNKPYRSLARSLVVAYECIEMQAKGFAPVRAYNYMDKESHWWWRYSRQHNLGTPGTSSIRMTPEQIEVMSRG